MEKIMCFQVDVKFIGVLIDDLRAEEKVATPDYFPPV
jgi:hypothetical protein